MDNNSNLNNNVGVTPNVTPTVNPNPVPVQSPVQNTIQPQMQTPIQNQPLQNNINYGNDFNNGVNSPKKGGKGKLVILIVLAILIVGAIILLVYPKFKGGSTAKQEKYVLDAIFDPDKPIVYEENDKYGYLSSNGEKLIEAKYIDAEDFYGDYAIVEVENTNQLIDVDTINQVIDKNGNVKIESKYAPNYYAEYDIWVIDSKLYDKSLKSITSEKVEVEYLDDGYFMFEDSENNEVGIINYKNNKIFSMPGNVASGHLSKNEFDKDDQYVFIKNYTTEPNKAVVVSLKSKKIVYTIEDFDNCIGSDEENGVLYYYRSGNYDNKTFLYFKDSKLMYQTTEPMDDLEVYDYKNDILELDYGWNYEEEYGKEKQSYYYDAKNGKLLDEKPSRDTSDDESDLLDDLDKEMEEIYGFKNFLY